MRTQIVSPREWHSFFRDFSRMHDGAPITINVTGPEIDAGDEIVDQPFRGISEYGDEVFVHVGGSSEYPRLDHLVQHADMIHLNQTDAGADAEVDISSLDGTRTTVRFRSPMLSELPDPAVE